MRRVAVILTLTLIAAATGCSNFQDYAIAERNRNLAYKAWKAARWEYYRQGTPYCVREHIGRGFRQGFVDVCAGGSGQLPLFAPSYYWGPEYQNARGNEYIAAYFRGYVDGAIAGEKTGLSNYVTLPTSSAPQNMNAAAAQPSDRDAWLDEGLPGENVPPRADDDYPLLLPNPTPPALDGPAGEIPPPVVTPLPGKQTRLSPTAPSPLGVRASQIKPFSGSASVADTVEAVQVAPMQR